MLSLSLDVDWDDYKAQVDEYLKKDVEPSLVDGVNRCADLAVKELDRQTPIFMDRPTDFTVHGWMAVKAQKGGEPVATVQAKPRAEQYLGFVVYGGTRQAGDYATTRLGPLVPGKDAPLDAYVNLPQGYVRQQLQDPAVSAHSNGTTN